MSESKRAWAVTYSEGAYDDAVLFRTACEAHQYMADQPMCISVPFLYHVEIRALPTPSEKDKDDGR